MGEINNYKEIIFKACEMIKRVNAEMVNREKTMKDFEMEY